MKIIVEEKSICFDDVDLCKHFVGMRFGEKIAVVNKDAEIMNITDCSIIGPFTTGNIYNADDVYCASSREELLEWIKDTIEEVAS